jgi:hypothetical protein
VQAAIGLVGRKKKMKKRIFQEYVLLQFSFAYLLCAIHFRAAYCVCRSTRTPFCRSTNKGSARVALTVVVREELWLGRRGSRAGLLDSVAWQSAVAVSLLPVRVDWYRE